jgi:hypothetical protein
MSALDDFVDREIELKNKLPFGEWLRHIRESHVELLRLLAAGNRPRPVEVDVVYRGDMGDQAALTFSLPPDCVRIVVDADPSHPRVRGFSPTGDLAGWRQVEGSLVSHESGPMIADGGRTAAG